MQHPCLQSTALCLWFVPSTPTYPTCVLLGEQVVEERLRTVTSIRCTPDVQTHCEENTRVSLQRRLRHGLKELDILVEQILVLHGVNLSRGVSSEALYIPYILRRR